MSLQSASAKTTVDAAGGVFHFEGPLISVPSSVQCRALVFRRRIADFNLPSQSIDYVAGANPPLSRPDQSKPSRGVASSLSVPTTLLSASSIWVRSQIATTGCGWIFPPPPLK
jgi:hypothetical protein